MDKVDHLIKEARLVEDYLRGMDHVYFANVIQRLIVSRIVAKQTNSHLYHDNVALREKAKQP